MALRGKIEQGARAMVFQDCGHRGPVADIGANENVIGIVDD
jgi:hypothetical protein